MTLREEALRLLRQASAAVAQGFDLAPTRRAEIETLFMQAMRQEQYSAQQLQADCVAILPEHCFVVVDQSGEEYPRVMLQLWQQRAPVVPSTKA